MSAHGNWLAYSTVTDMDPWLYWRNKGSIPDGVNKQSPQRLASASVSSITEIKPPVINGWLPPPEDLIYPYLATLHNNDTYTDYLCICAIMNPQYCITLASCVYRPWSNLTESQFLIKAFDDSIYNPYSLVYRISKIIMHPGFNGTHENDLAVIKVEPVFEFLVFQFISVFPLWAGPDDYIYIVGHGRDNDKMPRIFSELQVKLINTFQCEKLQHSVKVTPNMLCSEPPCNVFGPCGRDTAGGLYRYINYTAIGVTVSSSFHIVHGLVEDVFTCSLAGPTVYTNLWSFRLWLYANLQMDDNWWKRDHH